MQLSIRGDSVRLTEALREYITRRLHFALGRFASAIQRVYVRTEDINGPRGGIDKRCRVEVRLRAGRSVPLAVATDDSDLRAAIDRSAKRIARSVARELDRKNQRRTTRPNDSPLRNEAPVEEAS